MHKLGIVMALVVGGMATAGEKKLAERDVPRPVLDGVAKQYPTAKRLGYAREVEKGNTVYEVKLDADGRKIDLDVTPDGRILVAEEQIAVEATPEAVKRGLAASAKYGQWLVKRAEKVTATDGTPDKYELVVVEGKRKAELTFSADGKLLATERAAD